MRADLERRDDGLIVRAFDRLLDAILGLSSRLHHAVSEHDAALAPHRPVQRGDTVKCLPCDDVWPCREWKWLVLNRDERRRA